MVRGKFCRQGAACRWVSSQPGQPCSVLVQVAIDAMDAGLVVITVTGFSVPFGPQNYSLAVQAGGPRTRAWHAHHASRSDASTTPRRLGWAPRSASGRSVAGSTPRVRGPHLRMGLHERPAAAAACAPAQRACRTRPLARVLS